MAAAVWAGDDAGSLSTPSAKAIQRDDPFIPSINPIARPHHGLDRMRRRSPRREHRNQTRTYRRQQRIGFFLGHEARGVGV